MKKLEDLTSGEVSAENDRRINMTIDHFIQRHSDFDGARKCMLEYHISAVGKLLETCRPPPSISPSLSQIMLSAVVSSEDAGAEDAGELEEVWKSICHTIGLTPEQQKKLIKMKSGSVSKSLVETDKVLEDLSVTIAGKNASIREGFEWLRSVLTPKQCGLYLLWVTSNPACITILNRILAVSLGLEN
jgi:hypothetical protein